MRRRYASFATPTALPRTAYLAKCRRAASLYRNRPHPTTALTHYGGERRLALVASPALSERRHRRFACRLVAVRRAAYLAVVAARPHPMAVLWRNRDLEDAADDDTVI